MDKLMPNNAFMQYVFNRIEEVLANDPEFKQLQSDIVAAEKCGDTASLQEITCCYEAKAEELCYMAGFKDAIAILSNNN